MSNEVVPVEVFTALKKAMPDASDSDIGYAWKKSVENDPSLASADPRATAIKLANAFGFVKNDPQAAQAAVAPKAPTQQTVSPMDASTNIPVPQYDPYKGTGTSAASLISQYNPEVVGGRYDAAKADYDRRFKEQNDVFQGNLPSRKAASYFLAQGSLGGQAVRDLQKDVDAQNLLQTIGQADKMYGISKDQQDALFKTASEGLAAGKSAVQIQRDANSLFKEFTESASAGLNLQNQQDLNKPNSPQTLLARQLLTDQFKAAGIPLPAGLENANAVQLMPFMDPKVLSAFKEKTGIKSTQATTAKIIEETKKIAPEIGKITADTGKVIAETGEVKQNTGVTKKVTGVDTTGKEDPAVEQLRIISSELDKARAQYEAIPDKNSPQAQRLNQDILSLNSEVLALTKKNPGMSMPVGTSYHGKTVSVAPTPGAVAENTAASTQRIQSQEQFKNYQTIIQPKIDDTISLLNKTYAGKGAAAMASILPGNDQAVVASALNQLNQLYPSALPADISASLKSQAIRPGFNGTFQLSLTPAQSIKMLNDAKATVARMQQYGTAQDAAAQAGVAPADFYKTPTAKNTATGGVPSISTKAEYDKLKSGDTYLDATDGIQKRKK